MRLVSSRCVPAIKEECKISTVNHVKPLLINSTSTTDTGSKKIALAGNQTQLEVLKNPDAKNCSNRNHIDSVLPLLSFKRSIK